MLELIGKTDYSLTILTGNKVDGYINIEKEAKKVNVKKIKIIENYNNDFIPIISANHKVLLHLSTIEVCPYSVLEAMCNNLQPIINKDVNWGKTFFNEVEKISPSDVERFKEIVENHKEYLYSYEDYINKSEQQWKEYIFG
jgi:hypothetical protein